MMWFRAIAPGTVIDMGPGDETIGAHVEGANTGNALYSRIDQILRKARGGCDKD